MSVDNLVPYIGLEVKKGISIFREELQRIELIEASY